MKAPFNKQAIFDRVATALIAQGTPSVKRNGDCQYRGPGGTACGIGHIMSDDRLARKADRQGDTGVDHLEPRLLDEALDYVLASTPATRQSQVEFLEAIQHAHDQAAHAGWDTEKGKGIVRRGNDWLAEWGKRMREVAQTYRLKVGVLKAAGL